jgi:uncharacterized membrane protein YjgN (DUF898 family)
MTSGTIPESGEQAASPEYPHGPLQTGEKPDIEFTGLRGPLFRLALKNSVLTLLTLGIYRFWAKTWIRRYFWHNIRGEALEYTGLPSELLIGFLIALAILVPVFGLYNGITFLLQGSSETLIAVLDFTYFVLLFAFFQYAFYRMWRYRLSRTAWRGIHFGLDGSAFTYAGISIVWFVFAVITLGLAAPWGRVALWRYRARNMRFGTTHFDFQGSGKHLLLKWLITLWLPLIGLGILIGLNVDAIQELITVTNSMNNGEATSDNQAAVAELMNKMFGSMALGGVLLYIVFPLLMIWYRVHEARYMIAATRFLDTRFKAEIKPARVIWAFILFLLAIFAVIFCVSMLGTLTMFVSSQILGFVTAGIFIFSFVVIVPVLGLIILSFSITRHVCTVMEIENVEMFDQATQSARQGPQHGEGFADALDVGAM